MILFDILKNGVLETVCRSESIAERVAESYSNSFPLSTIEIRTYEVTEKGETDYGTKVYGNCD